MIKKLLASLGVGSAEVDTRLHSNIVTPGGRLSGEVLIRGGSVDQAIEDLNLFVMTEVEVEHGDGEFREPLAISRAPVARNFTVRAGEQLSIPFEIPIHPETPITELPRAGHGGKDEAGSWGSWADGPHNRTRVWLHTGLDIDNGVDANDRDMLSVRPTGPMLRFMAALENLGFVLFSADVERGNLRGGSFQSTIGCYQELEYREGYGRSTGIKQLEISFVGRPYDTGVLLEVDRRFSYGDSYRSFTIDHAGYEQVDWERAIQQALGRSW